MKWNNHSKIEGTHAFLSPSSYHWLGYDEEKLAERYMTHRAAAQGTRLHELAKELIELKIKLPKVNKTLNMFVNDAIGLMMQPEQTLFYSFNCYGTADAICFRDNLLRVHDLKTGVSKASFNQHKVYASLFCLEYDVNPNDILFDFRIYQNDSVEVYKPEPEEILDTMAKIQSSDRLINRLRMEV